MSREPATLLILAGGASKRMGFPKHELHVEGVDILTHLYRSLGHLFVEAIVVGRDIERIPAGVRKAEDWCVLRSPLAGIHAGLLAARMDLCFVIACDMPSVEPRLVQFLLTQAWGGYDVVVPVVSGHYEPLCAIYRRSCLSSIEAQVERGLLKVSDSYGVVNTCCISERRIRACDPTVRSRI